MVITIWLIEHPSRKRIYRLTSDEVNALRAYKRGEADAAQRLLCLPLLDRARHDKLWFECGCRREGYFRTGMAPVARVCHQMLRLRSG